MSLAGSILTGIVVAYLLNLVNFLTTTVRLKDKNDSIEKHLRSHKFLKKATETIGQKFEGGTSPQEVKRRTISKLNKLAEEFQDETFDNAEFFRLIIITLISYLFVFILMLSRQTFLLSPFLTLTSLFIIYDVIFYFYNRENKRFWRIVDSSSFSRKEIGLGYG